MHAYPEPGREIGRQVIWHPVEALMGVATDGCVLAAGVMACSAYGIAGVTQRAFAARLNVPFPPLGGIALDVLLRGLLAYGMKARMERRVSAALIRATIGNGDILIGAQHVDRGKRLGHAVVIAGIIERRAGETHVILLDPNLRFPVLVGIETIVASACGAIVCGGRT